MRVLGLHHTGLRVADLDRSLRFYHELLGIPVRERVDGVGEEELRLAGWQGKHARIADLDLGEGRVLELIELRGPPAPAAGDAHIALEVDDVHEAHRRVTQAGHAARSEPFTLHDAGPNWTGATLVYVSDPDGNAVELVQPAVGLARVQPPEVVRARRT
jgi:catechol 2,3-dioxygenase-like lactoylglutathione lyase family enzyme